MKKALMFSSLTALAIALSSTVFADQNKEIKEPVSDPAKQAKTEQMLKEEGKALSGDQGGGGSTEVKTPAPDAEAQAKTEKMLKEEAGAISGQ